MEMRTTKPGAGNKFYITTARGGYSTCIQGSPTDRECDVLANCVGYACGRFNEIMGSMKYPSLNCNAENFIERAQQYYGLDVKPYPTLGGIMVWQKGTSLSGNDGAGHVAVVERIDSTNQIYTSESGYSSSAFWNAVRKNDNGRWGMGSGYTFRGCIINPAIGDVHYIEPTPVDKFQGVSDEELARRVWAGEFGNGDDRRRALGSRYDAVQALVTNGVGKPSAPQPTEISSGDIVRVTGNGNASSDGTSRNWTRTFNNQTMKVIIIKKGAAYPYACNQYGTGTPGNAGDITGWFKESSVTK